MTIQQILNMVDEIYPNPVSPATKISFLNTAMGDMAREYGRMKEDVSTKTVVGQEEYSLPSDCIDFSHVEALWVSTTTTPTKDSDYQVYVRGFYNDNPKSSYTYYAIGDTEAHAVQTFGLTPIPTVVDLPIVIRYRSRNDSYTVLDLAEEPDIDSRWHDALAYYIVHMCASIGTIPDAAIANFWGDKYNDSIQNYKMAQNRKEQVAPKRRKDNPQWGVRGY